ncbi:MAG TPA: hypothetical protein VJT73_02820 [Polyangiaceae bacterium]|nr:hypothetical protein [Polyangiaceae bacterium]
MENPFESSWEVEVGGDDGPAERASRYVVQKVRVRSGHRFHQGPRRPALDCRSELPALRFVAEERLHRIPAAVARALVTWANGFPVELLTFVPSPAYVLALQASGRRCVSLLEDGVPTAPHRGSLDFALHDLCHLDKFADPEDHLGQVGFFACLHALVQQPCWAAFENEYDHTFVADWHHVAADMNGSAVFLFAALKMKLKMAVRRRLGSNRGGPTIEHGPLTAAELSAYRTALDEILSMLGFEPALADAAHVTSTRRDDPAAALRLQRFFEERGAIARR